MKKTLAMLLLACGSGPAPVTLKLESNGGGVTVNARVNDGGWQFPFGMRAVDGGTGTMEVEPGSTLTVVLGVFRPLDRHPEFPMSDATCVVSREVPASGLEVTISHQQVEAGLPPMTFDTCSFSFR